MAGTECDKFQEGVGCGFFLVAAEIVQRQGLQATSFFHCQQGDIHSLGSLKLSLQVLLMERAK